MLFITLCPQETWFPSSDMRLRVQGIPWHKMGTCPGRTNQATEARHHTQTQKYIHMLTHTHTPHVGTHAHILVWAGQEAFHISSGLDMNQPFIQYVDIQKPKVCLLKVAVLRNLAPNKSPSYYSSQNKHFALEQVYTLVNLALNNN